MDVRLRGQEREGGKGIFRSPEIQGRSNRDDGSTKLLRTLCVRAAPPGKSDPGPRVKRFYSPRTEIHKDRLLRTNENTFVNQVCAGVRDCLLSLPGEGQSVRQLNRFLYEAYAMKIRAFWGIMGVEGIADTVIAGTGLALLSAATEESGGIGDPSVMHEGGEPERERPDRDCT